MNKVIILGNLTAEPNVTYTTSNDPLCVCKMTVAVNEGYKDNKQTQFVPVTVFGRTAENCERYLTKGSKVCVSGKIQTGSYENKEGKKVYTTEVIAENIEFLGGSDQRLP